MLKALHGHVHTGVAAQRGGQRRNVRRPVAGIGHDNHVSGEFVAVSLDEGNEAWRAHLLFAFDEHFDIDVEVVAQSLQRTGVDGDAAAVIGGATAVKTAVDFGGHERVGVPLGRVRNRLHVVMGVEQHGGGVRRNDMRADDLPCARSAVGIGSLDHLGIHTHEAQFVCHEFSGALHMFGGDALGGNRLQRNLFGQHLDDAVPIGFDARTNLVSGERCHDGPPLYVCKRRHCNGCASIQVSERHRNLKA